MVIGTGIAPYFAAGHLLARAINGDCRALMPDCGRSIMPVPIICVMPEDAEERSRLSMYNKVNPKHTSMEKLLHSSYYNVNIPTGHAVIFAIKLEDCP